MKDLKQFLLTAVPPSKVYTDIFPDYKEDQNVECPFHEDSTPSASVRITDGAFYCHGCGHKNSSFIGFIEDYKKTSFIRAMEWLYSEYVESVIPRRRVLLWHRQLTAKPKLLRWIADKRGVNELTVKVLKLGWDGDRFMIPILNEYGLCVNVRKYHPKKDPKILSYKKGWGRARWYPMSQFRDQDQTVLLVEGEWDAILAWQMGYNTLTSTSGSDSMPMDRGDTDRGGNPLVLPFKGKEVTICYDADAAGTAGSRKMARNLERVASKVRTVTLPFARGGKDLTDFIVKEGKTEDDLRQAIGMAETISSNGKGEHVDEANDHRVHGVSISQASSKENFGRYIRTTAHITGKRLTPFLPPGKVSITCRLDRGKLCTTCHMLPKNGRKDFTLKVEDRRILGLVGASDSQSKTVIKDMCGIPTVCSVQLKVRKAFNIEEVTVSSPLDDAGSDGHYTSRLAYIVGHGIAPNRTYEFVGQTVPHPVDQSATHIFTEAIPAQSQLETYVPDGAVKERLQKFQAKPGEAIKKWKSIVRFLSEHVTRILQRPVMHMAIDLPFFSPLQFYFNNEKIRKGYLETAVIGDTRCGKGYVATELVRYYGLGELATAENCSFAGLIGGISKHQNNYSISWGLIPRNNGRLVVIDEASGLQTTDIARMTRVRSEGIAEIFKIQAEVTQARCRLIWLSNTRFGQYVASYSYGVECVVELFGKPEDVSRLDYAMVVSSGDVPGNVVNARRENGVGADAEYAAEDSRNLILWTWTRKPGQIFFEDEATGTALRYAEILGRTYHPSIPLIQVEDVRVKIAKISAAIAARLYSTDKTGESLIVREEHVHAAVKFLQSIYDTLPSNYLAYSRAQYETTSIENEKEVLETLAEYKEHIVHFRKGMLETTAISITDIADFLNCDKYTAKDIIGVLVRNRCLIKKFTFYQKRPAFINLLRRMG